MFFFFNATATTQIYTYLHTLSLHDALPISLLDIEEDHRSQVVTTSIRDFGQRMRFLAKLSKAHLRREKARKRSAENTSELQSLMRTSYDVFCLKKQSRSRRSHSPNSTRTPA